LRYTPGSTCCSIGKRQLGLVDAVSFVTMRQADLEEAFDPHFEQEGFATVAGAAP
jgi:hypothetical protein